MHFVNGLPGQAVKVRGSCPTLPDVIVEQVALYGFLEEGLSGSQLAGHGRYAINRGLALLCQLQFTPVL